MIRRDEGPPRRYPDAVLAALEKTSGAPRWLCELTWDESLEDRRHALELLKLFGPAFPATPDDAGAALARTDTPRQRAIDAGRARAREDLRIGERYRLGSGLIREPLSFCPRCRVRIAWTSERPDHCTACETPLFHARSTGCSIEPRTRSFVEGYRAEVDAYIRARFPEFSWEEVGG